MFGQAIQIIKKEVEKATQYIDQSFEVEYGSAEWKRLEEKRIRKEHEIDGQISMVAKMFECDFDEVYEMVWS